METFGSSAGSNTAPTNANGFYTLQGPVKLYSVLVSVAAPGFDGQSQTVLFLYSDNIPLPSIEADFVLSKPSATIWGTVTEGLDDGGGGAGSPAPGALVAAGSITTNTDSNGQYTLSNVPAGPVTLTVTASNPFSTLQHYVHYMQQSEVLQVAHGGNYQQDFALITKPPRKPVGEMPTPVPKTPRALKPGV